MFEHRVVFTGSKFTMCSQIKEKAIFRHNPWLFYLGICPENNCSDNYLNDSAGRISERIIDTVVETKTPTFSGIVGSKTTQILVRLTLRSTIVNLGTVIVD